MNWLTRIASFYVLLGKNYKFLIFLYVVCISSDPLADAVAVKRLNGFEDQIKSKYFESSECVDQCIKQCRSQTHVFDQPRSNIETNIHENNVKMLNLSEPKLGDVKYAAYKLKCSDQTQIQQFFVFTRVPNTLESAQCPHGAYLKSAYVARMDTTMNAQFLICSDGTVLDPDGDLSRSIEFSSLDSLQDLMTTKSHEFQTNINRMNPQPDVRGREIVYSQTRTFTVK